MVKSEVLAVLNQDADDVGRWALDVNPNELKYAIRLLVNVACDSSQNDSVRIKALMALRALPPDGRNTEPIWPINDIASALSRLLQEAQQLFTGYGGGKVVADKYELLNTLVWTARSLSFRLQESLRMIAEQEREH